MAVIFKIVRIDEPDFGCEGLPEGQPLKDEVTIEDDGGHQFITKIEDSLLYEKDLNEGDYFTVDGQGNIAKIDRHDEI